MRPRSKPTRSAVHASLDRRQDAHGSCETTSQRVRFHLRSIRHANATAIARPFARQSPPYLAARRCAARCHIRSDSGPNADRTKRSRYEELMAIQQIFSPLPAILPQAATDQACLQLRRRHEGKTTQIGMIEVRKSFNEVKAGAAEMIVAPAENEDAGCGPANRRRLTFEALNVQTIQKTPHANAARSLGAFLCGARVGLATCRLYSKADKGPRLRAAGDGGVEAVRRRRRNTISTAKYSRHHEKRAADAIQRDRILAEECRVCAASRSSRAHLRGTYGHSQSA